MTHSKIHHWMTSELNLKGSELLTYAVIYDYTNVVSGVQGAKVDEISKRINIVSNTVNMSIESLLFKGFIEVKIINHKNDYVYRAVDRLKLKLK